MTKFMRKNAKWILAVLGSFLMVAFLVPDLMQRLAGDPTQRKVATIVTASGAKRTIRADEIDRAARFLEVLKTCGSFNELPQPIFTAGILQQLGVSNAEHWFLLTTAAKEAGLIGGPGEGQILRDEILENEWFVFRDPQAPTTTPEEQERVRSSAKAEAARFFDGQIMQGLGRARMMVTDGDIALAQLRGVLRLQQIMIEASRLSDRATLVGLAEEGETAFASYVVVPATRYIGQAGEPTEQQLAEHFAKYKDIEPGAGELGFGYKLPARVKLEYLTLERAQVASVVQVDPVEVRKSYDRQRDKYPGEFAAERARVESALREARVDEIMDQASKLIEADIQRVLKKLTRRSGVYELPADWASQKPRFEAVAASVVEGLKGRINVTIPVPAVTVKAAEFQTFAQVAGLPGIGASSIRVGTRTTPFASLVFNARELHGEDFRSDPIIQAGVPFAETPLRDAAGNKYFFTVLEARQPSGPDSLDAVRAEVVRDVKLAQAYAAVRASKDAMLALASQPAAGLDAVAKQIPAEVTGAPPMPIGSAVVQKDWFFTRQGASLFPGMQPRDEFAPVANQPEVVKAVLDAAAKLDPLAPVAPENASARTVWIDVPAKQASVIATITQRRPLTRETFTRVADQGESQLRFRELREAMGTSSPLSIETLRDRYAWKNLGADGDEIADAPAGDPAAVSDATSAPASPAAK